MSSPDSSDKLNPIIDLALLERNGNTFKDTHSAAATRAAYFMAMTVKRAKSSAPI